MKKVAVVVLHYSDIENTKECISSLKKTDDHGIDRQIIVVNNGSKDVIELKDIKLLSSDTNLGYAGGNNLGIQWAMDSCFDYIVILSNDTFVEKHSIGELVKIAQSDERVGIVAPKIYFAKGFEFHKDRYDSKDQGKIIWYAGGIIDWANVIGSHRGVDEVDHGQYDSLGLTDYASGCCMLVKKEVFENVGFFDTRYFLYYEDADFSERVKKAGFTIMYNPKAILWHKNAGSAGGSGSSLQDYYMSRNRLLFGFLYAPIRSKLALWRQCLRIFVAGPFWKKMGVLDFYRRKFGKGSFNP